MASPASRASHIGYVPTPLRGICCPCPPAVMHHLTHLWTQCINPVAMRHLSHPWTQCIAPVACDTSPVCGRNVSTPSYARSAYRSIACGETRVAGDATGCITPLHNHAASRRRKTYYRRYIIRRCEHRTGAKNSESMPLSSRILVNFVKIDSKLM